MIPVFGCETSRELLDAFIDGELSMPQQVAMQAHIRSCRTCSAHVDDMSLIGWSTRNGLARTTADDAEKALSLMQSNVLARVRAERAQAFTTRFAEMFDDMRLVWPALGASLAVLLCMLGSARMWQLATQKPPDSFAATLARYESARGSDRNPLRLDDAAWAPRILHEGVAVDGLLSTETDGDLIFDTLLTQSGHVGEARLLNPVTETVNGARSRSRSGDAERLMRQLRVTPAHSRGGRPVAVRTIIWFSQTTVTALQTADPFPRRRAEPPRVPVPPVGTRSSIERPAASV